MNWRKRDETDLDEEIRSHIEIEARRRIADGEPPEQAWSGARREFGNLTHVKESVRDEWRWTGFERLGQDFRFASRMLRKNLSFTLTAMSILALGIGATTAVFSLLDAVVLRPLPVTQPEQLVWLEDPSFSYPLYEEVRSYSQDIFQGVFAWNRDRLLIDWKGDAESTPTLTVTANFHETLGVTASRGRLLSPADERANVAVISDACWRNRFQAGPAVIGQTLIIQRVPFTIIGVTQPGFFGVAAGLSPEVTIPIGTLPVIRPNEADVLRMKSRAWLHIMARLKPGVSIESANAAFQTFWPRAVEVTIDPGLPADRRKHFLSRKTSLQPGREGFSPVRRQFSESLWILFGLVGLLLTAACASVANLLIARGSARRHEIAVRRALGASGSRIVRQLLTEGLLLAGLGAALGLLFAAWGAGLIVRLLSTVRDPLAVSLQPNPRVLAFTAVAALMTAIFFSIAPALRSARVAPSLDLQGGVRALGRRGRRWLGPGLVVAQVSLSVILLSGAVLFARSLDKLLSVETGLDRSRVLVLTLDAAAAGYQGPRYPAFFEQLLAGLAALPAVESASLSAMPPISNEYGGWWTQSIGIDGAPPAAGSTNIYFNAVSPKYFTTVGTRLLRGRDFGAQDRLTAPKVVIVNESLARAYFPGQDPVGRRITLGRDAAQRSLEIIGLVQDAKYQRIQEPARRIAYLPYRQTPVFLDGTLAFSAEVRSSDPTLAAAAIRAHLREMDRTIPVRIETVDTRIADTVVKERALTSISVTLGLLGLVLAAGGLYGLIAYSVARRTNEIGLRVALGARPATVLRMVLGETSVLAVLGIAGGIAASLALGRFLSGLTFGIEPSDPVSLVGASALMLTVALLAGLIPARRAAAIDPAAALRRE